MSEKYRIELRNRWRTTDETLQSLHADIRRLAALAYKGVPPEMRDQVTCDSFLDALAFKMRERQPTDLNSALRIALQLEVWAKEMNRHRGSPRPDRMEGRRVREINRKDEFHKNQDTTNSKRHTGYPRGVARNQAGAPAGGYRPPAAARYAAPSAPGGPTAPPRPRGQYPASYGRAEVAQPSRGNGNRNLYQAPVMFSGCYNCGDPSHHARECPTRPTTPAPQAVVPRQPDVQPMKRRSDKKIEKTCIRVKYHQHKLSALIDTGSDVSIAGQDVARKLGWPIHAHHTKEVSVVYKETMTISGVVRIWLRVGRRQIKAEILVSPDFEGLILGYDWLHQQGSVD